MVVSFEDMHVRQQIRYNLWLGQTFTPTLFLHRADDQIVIADDRGIHLGKQAGQQMFDLVFVANEQVAVTTVATRVVKGDQLMSKGRLRCPILT